MSDMPGKAAQFLLDLLVVHQRLANPQHLMVGCERREVGQIVPQAERIDKGEAHHAWRLCQQQTYNQRLDGRERRTSRYPCCLHQDVVAIGTRDKRRKRWEADLSA